MMLSDSGFEPLAQSMNLMLREESFHHGTGHHGLKRIVKAGVVSIRIAQKYVNKWIPVSHDLFDVDQSRSAHWSYVWGLKGPYEAQAQQIADLGHRNEHNCRLYCVECKKLVERINKYVPAGQSKLYLPDLRFNRHIGEFAGQPYGISDELLSPAEFAEHRKETLLQPEDIQLVDEIEDVVDDANFTMALVLHAAAVGAPFMLTYATLGSDLLKKNGNLREFPSLVNEEKLIAVRTLRFDVAILQVQRADAQGNAPMWRSLGVAVGGARAARKVMIVAEEIVEPAVIASGPESHPCSGISCCRNRARTVGCASVARARPLRQGPRAFFAVPRADAQARRL